MGLLDTLGDIASGAKDVGGTVASDAWGVGQHLLPGGPERDVYNFVTGLPHQMSQIKALTGFSGPEAYYQAQRETGIDYSDQSLGGFVRNMSRTPFFNTFVPGLQTAGNVTTPQGREQIMQHPVTTALDVGGAAALGYGGMSAGLSRALGADVGMVGRNAGIEAYFGGQEPGSLIEQATQARAGTEPTFNLPPVAGNEEAWKGLLDAIKDPSKGAGATVQNAIEKLFNKGQPTDVNIPPEWYDPTKTVNYNPGYYKIVTQPRLGGVFNEIPGLQPPGGRSGPINYIANLMDRPLAPGQTAGPFQDIYENFYPPITRPPLPPYGAAP